jgi:protein tyrosine phosphatase (PTP) superfamily phosphohydrolase (DUF442 family)
MTGGNIPAPLPRAGDTYTVTGYEPGIRFYVLKYDNGLYRGGDIRSRDGFESLKKLGIKTIIATDPTDDERTLAKEYGMKYVEIPFGLYDLNKADLDMFLAAVQQGPAPIYVKSFGGDLQAAILVAHYRIHREGWSVDKALDEFYRLDANFWDSLGLVQVLKDNATTAPAAGATTPRKTS